MFKLINGKIITDAPNGASSTIATLDGRLQQAIQQYEADNAELYRPDGSHKYSVKEFKARVDAAKQRLVAVADKIKAEAEAIRIALDAQKLSASIDPLLQITSEVERNEVGYKRGIISETVDRLPLPELAQQLEAMEAFGSRVERLLYARYAADRVKREEAQLNGGDDTGVLRAFNTGGDILPQAEAGSVVQGLTEARAALAKLQESTDSDQAAKRAAADATKLVVDSFFIKLNMLLDEALDPYPMTNVIL